MRAPFTIAVDFDGTIVEHRWPDIGREIPGAVQTLQGLQAAGARLILWTVRGGLDLDAAVAFCESRGLRLWDVNGNREAPTLSPKVLCDVFVDDRGLGCPLTADSEGHDCCDWGAIAPALRAMFERHRRR